jgi:predicted amidohydrolase YtcJ
VSKGHSHHRIEHAQFLRPTDVQRFCDLGIAASVQPAHLDLDIGKLRSVFPTPHRGSYAFQSLLSAGTDLCFGSDAPVEEPDPLKGMSFAAFRQRAGEEPYQPEQCVSLAEALSSYTTVPQDVVGLAGKRGNLLEGQDADVVVLSRNVLRCTCPRDVSNTYVAATIVDGALAYEA